MSFEAARPAGAGDLADIEWVGSAVLDGIGEQRGGSVFSQLELGFGDPRSRARDALASGEAICVVGTFDSVVFGYAICHLVSLDGGARIGRLLDFAVHPAARGVAIGEAMMNHVVAWLTDQSCIGVDAWALPGDRGTKNFFESFGLKARLLTAHRAFAS